MTMRQESLHKGRKSSTFDSGILQWKALESKETLFAAKGGDPSPKETPKVTPKVTF